MDDGTPAAFGGVGVESSRSGPWPDRAANVLVVTERRPPAQVADGLMVESDVLGPGLAATEAVVECAQLHAGVGHGELERHGEAGEARQITRRHPAAMREGSLKETLGCAAHVPDAVVGDEEETPFKVDEEAEVADAR